MKVGQDSLHTKSQLEVDDTRYSYFSLPALQQQATEAGNEHFDDIAYLPYSLKVLLENLLRHEDGERVTRADIDALIRSIHHSHNHEIAYSPVRVLMQDFTGVPAIVDLAAMRDAVTARGENPALVNPLNQVDLVIDHSVTVDKYGSDSAYRENVAIEMERNYERYSLLRWGQSAFDNFRVVPPGTGICHQVNLEYLAQTVWSSEEAGERYAYPDTLVGTDSHTTMINGLGVLGWGVGGIEAEAAMLGQPVSMLIPEVIGFKLSGELREGVTATDLVLTVVQMLREHGVVGKFVEFYGKGLNQLPLADRATIANMSPEFGATCGFFPVDQETVNYLRLTGRDEHCVKRVEAYAKAQGMWRDDSIEPVYHGKLELDLAEVVPSLAGPIRPQDRVALSNLKETIAELIELSGHAQGQSVTVPATEEHPEFELDDGDVVIAAITSCTNTSNPAVMMAAGLLARNAIKRGLNCKPWVKASLAPGSKVVTDYLEVAGFQQYLDQLGFNLVGYGCTTCIGNSGPLPEDIEKAGEEGNLTLCSVLSGNRNFEGRIHPKVKANWLASPPLVVAMALAGTTRINLTAEPLGVDDQGQDVFLKDIWPSNKEVADAVALVSQEMFATGYKDVFTGDETWRSIPVGEEETFPWNEDSTYVRNPPFFEQPSTGSKNHSTNIENANILALLGDSITTDHISPAGSIAANSPAGQYLQDKGIAVKDFNSYGSRRGNHEVMMRGTFANVRIKNEMCPGVEGGYTRYIPDDTQMPIYDAAMAYQQQGTPLVVIAGKEYGTGSSRDWAAKGTLLLGVKAVVAESFERIHRSNLVGMGVLPLQFTGSDSRKSLKLDGSEQISIEVPDDLKAGTELTMHIAYNDGTRASATLRCRIDTDDELSYFKNGGILSYVLEQLIATGGGGNGTDNGNGGNGDSVTAHSVAGKSATEKPSVRIEQDSLGDVEVSDNALWGAQTQRSLQNFRIGRQHFPQQFIYAYAELKKAAAIMNAELGRLPEDKRDLIIQACDEIISGEHDDQFPLVIWQTGSGTQTNMNLNEVIANRANELAGSGRGAKQPIHPNDHVNLSQSSNDSFPAAMHITTAVAVHHALLPALDKLLLELQEKCKAFGKLVKSGRTHMMDATPVTLGQEFSGYHAQLEYAREQIVNAMPGIYALAIGGSAVGTGLNTHPDWSSTIVRQLALQTGVLFTSADNKFAALASHDAMTSLHAQLKLLATNLMKMGNDLRLMASGPRCGLNEIQLPSNEPGSSIMPGKVNPTQIEALTMVATQVMGNDVAVSIANSQGQFELNVYKPLIMHNLYESIELLSDVMHSFTDNCLTGLEANEERLQQYLNNSLMLVTALTPKIGYDNAAKAAKLAFEKDITLKEAVLELQLLSADEFDEWVDPSQMLGPRA